MDLQELTKKFENDRPYLYETLRVQLGTDGIKSLLIYVLSTLDRKQVKVEPEVIVKLAEKRIDKLWKKKIPYVNDECDDIVGDIENEIDLLKQLVNGLNYYIKNISKFTK